MYQLFARILCNSYSGKYIENLFSVISRKTAIVEIDFSKFGRCEATTLPRKLRHDFFP